MTDDVRASANQVENQTKRINKSISGIKSFVAKATAGLGLFKLGQEAIQVASNIQEVQNVVDVAFGDMTWKAEKFAKTAIAQFGMSELSAKKTASTYMAMAKSMGINEQASSDMAINLAKLSGDVASFFNISQELADVRLKSVFTGETETLKELGVVMTQANLQQFAYSQGINKNIRDMSQAEITTLRYRFVMESLAMAQGDFARTSGSWANQIRLLKEQWKQLLGIIGDGLISVLTPVIQVINAVISKIISFANIVSAVFGKLFGKGGGKKKSPISSMNDDANNASKSIGGVGKSLDKAGSKAKKAAKEAKGFLAGFDDLNIMTSSNSESGANSGGSSGVGGGAGYDVGSIDWSEEPDTSGIDKAVDKIMKKIETFKNYISKNAPLITSLIAGIAAGFIAFETVMHWGTIVSAISAMVGPFQWISSAVSTLVGSIAEGSGILVGFQTVFGTVAGTASLVAIGVGSVTAALVYLYQTSETFRNLVNEAVASISFVLMKIYNSVLKPLFSFISDVFKTILVPIATFLASVFVKAVEAVATVVLSIWNNILAPLANFVVDILGIALQGLIDIWLAWKPGIEVIFDALMWIWDNALSPLVDFIVGKFCDGFKAWGELIDRLIPPIKAMFQGLVDFFVGVFTLDMEKAWNGITSIFKGFGAFLTNVFKTDWTKTLGALGVPLNTLCSTIKSIWNTIKGVFNGITTFVSGVFTGNWKKAWQGVRNIFSSIVSGLANIFKAPINAIISGINTFIGGLNKIKIPDWVPGVGGYGISIPKIPKLAQGGIVNKSTLGIFGEAGTEAVVPLKKNTQGLDMIADKIISRMPINNSNGGTYVINVVLETGERLTRKIIKDIKEYEIKTGEPVFEY